MAVINRAIIGATSYMLTIPYYVCSTAASTAAKSISSVTDLSANDQIKVKFTNGNTSSSPTLSVNSGAAIPIIGSGLCKPEYFSTAGSIMHLVYDGTNLIILG